MQDIAGSLSNTVMKTLEGAEGAIRNSHASVPENIAFVVKFKFVRPTESVRGLKSAPLYQNLHVEISVAPLKQ